MPRLPMMQLDSWWFGLRFRCVTFVWASCLKQFNTFITLFSETIPLNSQKVLYNCLYNYHRCIVLLNMCKQTLMCKIGRVPLLYAVENTNLIWFSWELSCCSVSSKNFYKDAVFKSRIIQNQRNTSHQTNMSREGNNSPSLAKALYALIKFLGADWSVVNWLHMSWGRKRKWPKGETDKIEEVFLHAEKRLHFSFKTHHALV